MASRAEEDIESALGQAIENLAKLSISDQSINQLVDQASGKLTKPTISNQPQSEAEQVKHSTCPRQHSIRKHPYQRFTAGNTKYTIYLKKGANIYTSSEENPAVIVVRPAKEK